MRHTTLAIALLASAVSSAQDYLGNDPIWQVRSICAVPSPCILYDTYNYRIAGDSVINAITWKKVVREGIGEYQWQGPPPGALDCQGTFQYGTDLHGITLIRQVGRQLRMWAGDMEALLYDFDLQVGQYLPVTAFNWNTDITVLAVDSVLIGTEMRARYELGNSWAQYLIEGVGSSHGLFEPVSNFFECGYELLCFGLGAQSYYPSATANGCALALGLDERKARNEFRLSPNPANDELVLTGAGPGDAITMLDALGRAVLRDRATSANLRLDVAALPPGAYTLVCGEARQRLLVAR